MNKPSPVAWITSSFPGSERVALIYTFLPSRLEIFAFIQRIEPQGTGFFNEVLIWAVKPDHGMHEPFAKKPHQPIAS